MRALRFLGVLLIAFSPAAAFAISVPFVGSPFAHMDPVVLEAPGPVGPASQMAAGTCPEGATCLTVYPPDVNGNEPSRTGLYTTGTSKTPSSYSAQAQVNPATEQKDSTTQASPSASTAQKDQAKKEITDLKTEAAKPILSTSKTNNATAPRNPCINKTVNVSRSQAQIQEQLNSENPQCDPAKQCDRATAGETILIMDGKSTTYNNCDLPAINAIIQSGGTGAGGGATGGASALLLGSLVMTSALQPFTTSQPYTVPTTNQGSSPFPALPPLVQPAPAQSQSNSTAPQFDISSQSPTATIENPSAPPGSQPSGSSAETPSAPVPAAPTAVAPSEPVPSSSEQGGLLHTVKSAISGAVSAIGSVLSTINPISAGNAAELEKPAVNASHSPAPSAPTPTPPPATNGCIAMGDSNAALFVAAGCNGGTGLAGPAVTDCTSQSVHTSPALAQCSAYASELEAKIERLTPEQLQGKQIIIDECTNNVAQCQTCGTGSCPVTDDIKALTAKGVDPRNIMVTGINENIKPSYHGINVKLKNAATTLGAGFEDTSNYYSGGNIHLTSAQGALKDINAGNYAKGNSQPASNSSEAQPGTSEKPYPLPGKYTDILKKAEDGAGLTAKGMSGILQRFVNIENPGQNPNTCSFSGPCGLFQYAGSTWNTWSAAANNGVSLPLSDRADPALSAKVTANYIATNLNTYGDLIQKSGMDPAAAAYAIHNIGDAGGPKFIQAFANNPNAPVSSVLDQTTIQNNPVVYHGGGITLAQAQANMLAGMNHTSPASMQNMATLNGISSGFRPQPVGFPNPGNPLAPPTEDVVQTPVGAQAVPLSAVTPQPYIANSANQGLFGGLLGTPARTYVPVTDPATGAVQYYVVASDASSGGLGGMNSIGTGVQLGQGLGSMLQGLFGNSSNSQSQSGAQSAPLPPAAATLNVQPQTVSRGDTIGASWSSTNAAACSVTQNGESLGSGLAGSSTIATASSTPNSIVVRLVCTASGNGQLVQQSVTVTVQ